MPANEEPVLKSLDQAALRVRALQAGVQMIDPDAVWLAEDTRFGKDVVIEPMVFFGPGEMLTQSLSGKGRKTTLTASTAGTRFAIYSYSKNGKKQVSQLCAPIYVTV